MAAKVIVVLSNKGGSGRTMVAGQLAGALAALGRNVLAVDLDPKGCLSRWACQAEGDKHGVKALNLSRASFSIPEQLEKIAERHYDFVVVDTPRIAYSDAAAECLFISDLALIPICPDPLDIVTLPATQRLCRLIKHGNKSLKVRTVLTRVKSKCKRANELFEALNCRGDMPPFNSRLVTRDAYILSWQQGGTVHHVQRARAAIREVDALAQEVVAELG